MDPYLKSLHDSKPVIKFKRKIFEDGYQEPGMMARVERVVDSHDGLYELHVNYEEFDEYNKTFELCDYYGKGDKEGQLVTAREAGYYDVREFYYLDKDQDYEEYFEVANPDSLIHLYNKREDKSLSYVQWLESMLTAAIAANKIRVALEEVTEAFTAMKLPSTETEIVKGAKPFNSLSGWSDIILGKE